MSFRVLRPILTADGMIEAGQEERVCREWSQSWVKALRLMREDGVLERAVWVPPLNEVPVFLGSMLPSVKVSDPTPPESLLLMIMPPEPIEPCRADFQSLAGCPLAAIGKSPHPEFDAGLKTILFAAT